LQEITIVAGNLNHKTLGVEAARTANVAYGLFRMSEQRIRERREIKVFAEQLLGRYRLRDLNERTSRTENEFEWVNALRFRELLGGKQGIGERSPAEVEDGAQFGRSARPAPGRLWIAHA
jgi:hypothetical protein